MTCTFNDDCMIGRCCEYSASSLNYRKCRTTPITCYTGDGTHDVDGFCTQNSDCATRCCHFFEGKCITAARTINCMVTALPGWIIISISLALLAIGLTVFFIFCCRRYRRN